jgi:hypothetical protein
MMIKHLGSGIVLIEDLLTQKELSSIDLNLIEQQCPRQGFRNIGEKTFLEGGYEVDLEKDFSHLPTRFIQNIESLPFFKTIDDAMYQGAVQYCKLFPVAAESITNCVGKHFIKYLPGGHMGPHSDSSLAYKDGTLEPVSVIALGNTITSSIILNDDFDGGSILFNTCGFEVKPKPGSALYYPSNYIGAHQVNTVTSGVRWAFLAFYSHGDRTFVSDSTQEQYPERYEWTMNFRQDIRNGFDYDHSNLNLLQKKVEIYEQ